MALKKNSDFIDLKHLFRQYLSHWYLFVISVVVCMILGFLYLRIKKPVYAVKANVLISQEDNNSGGAMAVMGTAIPVMGDIFGSNGYVDDEIFIISSHSVYRDVVKELGLNVSYRVRKGFLNTVMAYPEHPVDISTQKGLLDTLQNAVTFKLKVNEKGIANITAKMKGDKIASAADVKLPYTLDTPVGKFSFAKTASYPEGEDVNTTIRVCSYDAAAENLDEDVHNEIASKRSNVISMSINTPNPEYGKDILNAIIAEYNKRGIDQKIAESINTTHFIDERLGLLGKDIDDAELLIQSYKQKEGIVDVGTEAKFQTEKRARVEAELIEAKTQLEVIKMIQDFINNPANAYNLVPMTIENEGLWRSIQAYNEILLARQRMSEKVGPENKAMRDLDNDIRMSRQNIKESFAKAAQNASVAVVDLERVMASTTGSLANIPAQQREYVRLYRENSVKSNLYVYLLQRREEASMTQANTVPKGVIVDEAYTMSEPLGMKPKMILALLFLFSLMLPPIYLYIRRVINNRFESRAEVEKITDVPILGEMCIDKSGEALVATEKSTSPTAELFRLLRTNLGFILKNKSEKVILLTSSTSGEGKSFISINLAASFALLNKKVVLVGLDIRNPRLNEYIGIKPKFGLTQYLSSNDLSTNQIITPMPGVKDMDVIVAGPVPPNPAELLTSEKLDDLFTYLRTVYDYIIVDTAPIGLVSDTFSLNRLADATIYVCRANYTSLADLSSINEIYEHHQLKNLSIIVNGTAAKKTYGYRTREA